MMRAARCTLLMLLFSFGSASAAIQVYTTLAAFNQATGSKATLSFDTLPVGLLPFSSANFTGLTVSLTNSGSFPIFGPGPLGFTTNFLSTGVKSGDNEVVMRFVPSVQAAAFQIASPATAVTIVVMADSGETLATAFGSPQSAFLGFIEPLGLRTITITSPAGPFTPIVNIGDITLGVAAPAAPPAAATIPTASSLGLLLMAALLAVAGWRALAPPR